MGVEDLILKLRIKNDNMLSEGRVNNFSMTSKINIVEKY
jgi:hypothetical protein